MLALGAYRDIDAFLRMSLQVHGAVDSTAEGNADTTGSEAADLDSFVWDWFVAAEVGEVKLCPLRAYPQRNAGAQVISNRDGSKSSNDIGAGVLNDDQLNDACAI